MINKSMAIAQVSVNDFGKLIDFLFNSCAWNMFFAQFTN